MLEVELKPGGSYYLMQPVDQAIFETYVETKQNGSTQIPEDMLDYLDYNCAQLVPTKIDNRQVYFLTNDISHN